MDIFDNLTDNIFDKNEKTALIIIALALFLYYWVLPYHNCIKNIENNEELKQIVEKYEEFERMVETLKASC